MSDTVTVAIPLRQTRIFVVKVASRCNLACTYCYMYEHADQSWRSQPKVISRATVRKLGERIEEYARTLKGGSLTVVAHGGEPLLNPDLDFFFTEIRRLVTSCEVVFAIQTNGTLVSPENLTILEKHAVRIGMSIDGNRETHDRQRVTHSGKGSYDQVVRGLLLARIRAPQLMQSVLQVIDITIPPVEILNVLESYEVPQADLLLPDLNHDTLAPSGIRPGEIGQWLTEVFDEWSRRRNTVQIRTFVTIIRLLLGGKFGTDQLGRYAAGAMMIETDGSYQVYDALKTTFDGAGHTGMNLVESPIGNVDSNPLIQAFRDKASGAARECLECGIFSVCGGGSPLHRYGEAHGFDQPSVYCKDLILLIEHIHSYLKAKTPEVNLVF